MTITQICEVKDNQLIIRLPEHFTDKKEVLVTVNDSFDEKAAKLTLLQEAMNDPLFLEDVAEIQADFQNIDHEGLQ